MKIKTISLAIILSSLGTFAQSQEFYGLVEGKDYTKSKISNTIVNPNQSKSTFVEFFWYGCSHCYNIKDASSKIAKKHASKINYIKFPVAFPNWESGVKMFYTFEEMKNLDKMHDKAFDHIHRNRVNILGDKSKLDTFLTSNGVDVKNFHKIYNSFSIAGKLNKAKAITESHKIDGTPLFAVYSGGYTYQISPAQSGGYEKALANLDKILATKAN